MPGCKLDRLGPPRHPPTQDVPKVVFAWLWLPPRECSQVRLVGERPAPVRGLCIAQEQTFRALRGRKSSERLQTCQNCCPQECPAQRHMSRPVESEPDQCTWDSTTQRQTDRITPPQRTYGGKNPTSGFHVDDHTATCR